MRLVVTAVALVLFAGIALADEFNATVTKVEGNNVTFYRTKKGEKGEAMTLPLAADAKIAKGMAKGKGKKGKVEVGDPIEGGAKSETFTKIGETGLRARITTDDDNKKITQLLVLPAGKKKKMKDAE